MESANVRFRMANWVTMILFAVLSVAIGFWMWHTRGLEIAWKGWIAPLFLLIPPLARRLFRLRPAYLVDIGLYGFIFIAFDLGIALGGYGLPYVDKLVHGLSGAVFAEVGLCVYYWLNRHSGEGPYQHPPVAAATAFLFAQTAASFWEFIEYFGYVFWKHDAQHMLTTGTGDTMQDMLACLAGSVLLCVPLYVCLRRQAPCWLLRPALEFFETNGGPRD